MREFLRLVRDVFAVGRVHKAYAVGNCREGQAGPGAYVEDNGRSGGPGGGEGGFWRESFQVLCGETGELPGESFSVSNILLHPSMRWLVA